MHHSDTQDSRKAGVGLIVVGATLFAVATACAVAAVDHMAAVALCGPVARHCLLCVTSAGSLLASVGVVSAGAMLLQPPASLQRARSRPVRSN